MDYGILCPHCNEDTGIEPALIEPDASQVCCPYCKEPLFPDGLPDRSEKSYQVSKEYCIVEVGNQPFPVFLSSGGRHTGLKTFNCLGNTYYFSQYARGSKTFPNEDTAELFIYSFLLTYKESGVYMILPIVKFPV